MSTASPHSLLYLTVDFVVRNYSKLCEIRRDVVDHENQHSLLVFKNNFCLPANVCDLLLQRFFFVHNVNFPMEFLTLFTDPHRCPLKRFCLGRQYGGLDYIDDSLMFILRLIIRNQDLLELDLGCISEQEMAYDLANAPASLQTCVSFAGNYTHLKHLSFRNCSYIDDSKVEVFASELRQLESLDLSSTSISNAHAFGRLSTQLKVLILHSTPLVEFNLTDLLRFSSLHHLDISQPVLDGIPDNFYDKINMFFTSESNLHILKSLDISGYGKLDSDALQGFLQNHSTIQFLGLLNCHHRLSNTIFENIEVTGIQSLKQVLASLRHYRNRPLYLTMALKELFNLSRQNSVKENVELRKYVVEMLLYLMRMSMDRDNGEGKENLQMAASACVYNYVRYDTEKSSNSLHLSILGETVEVVMQVMKSFARVEQVQRNCLLVLYNKYILSAVKFNAYKLCSLVFKAMLLLPEGTVTSVALDMIAYLSSRISVSETLTLGVNENIQKLLSIIRRQVVRATVDSLLLCALRVLWNLTDEAAKTCGVVVSQNGLKLLLRAMQAFDDKSEVLTKILGVMNNLAEVVNIRPMLINDALVSLLRKYLDMNYSIEVSYFAAGTLCNLIIVWPDELVLGCGTRSDILYSVGGAVNRWKKVDSDMVGYRTFKSFIPLLKSQFPDVQLWAVWAIHHCCSHKIERYGQLCNEEGVVSLLTMRTSSANRSDVRELARQALDAVST